MHTTTARRGMQQRCRRACNTRNTRTHLRDPCLAAAGLCRAPRPRSALAGRRRPAQHGSAKGPTPSPGTSPPTASAEAAHRVVRCIARARVYDVFGDFAPRRVLCPWVGVGSPTFGIAARSGCARTVLHVATQHGMLQHRTACCNTGQPMPVSQRGAACAVRRFACSASGTARGWMHAVRRREPRARDRRRIPPTGACHLQCESAWPPWGCEWYRATLTR